MLPWRITKEVYRRSLRKKVVSSKSPSDLKRCLNLFDIVAIGIGATLGAGIYVLVGVVAREQTGPALFLSFAFSGVACMLSALSYAEFAAQYPLSGSAYTYTYVALGEILAWFIGWNLSSEYVIGAASVARAWTGYANILTGGYYMDWWSTTYLGGTLEFDLVSPVAIMVVTVLLCFGMSESKMVTNVITVLNMLVIVFVVVVGSFYVDLQNWSPFLPHGVGGLFSGAATVFYAYIGFDTICTTAEEIHNPQRDLPLGVISSLTICGVLYMAASVVITLMVPYNTLDVKAPLASAFAVHGVTWAKYIITVGALCGLTTTLITSVMPQPRVFYSMARDGLLFQAFGRVNKRFQTPIFGTLVTGVLASALAFVFTIDVLAEMMSVGTLMAFLVVCYGVVVKRYEDPRHPYRVLVLILVQMIIAVCGSVVFAFGLEWESLPILGLTVIPMIPLLFFAQPGRPSTFQCPLVPLVPMAGGVVNIFMMSNLGAWTWVRLAIWFAIGFAIYFGYGIRRSRVEDLDGGEDVRGSDSEEGDESSATTPPSWGTVGVIPVGKKGSMAGMMGVGEAADRYGTYGVVEPGVGAGVQREDQVPYGQSNAVWFPDDE